jgi:hypothetical protein
VPVGPVDPSDEILPTEHAHGTPPRTKFDSRLDLLS